MAVASDVGDPSATRTVYLTVVLLAALGVLLAGLAIWVLRRTKPEPELLSPLETMDTRSWRKLDPAAQRRLLDEARPPDALPLRREASEPVVDASFATVAPVASFDDLSENAPGAHDRSDPVETDADADVDDLGRNDHRLDDQDVGDQDVGDPGDVDPGDMDPGDMDPGASDRHSFDPVVGDPSGQHVADDKRAVPLDDTEESDRIAVPDDLDVDSEPGSDGGESGDIGDVEVADPRRSIDPLLTSESRSSDASN